MNHSTLPEKEESLTSTTPEELESSPNFTTIESHIFTEHNGDVYLGKEKLSQEMRDLLREQARYIERSNLWEIVNATIVNEAYDISLKQSKDFDEVRTAKMLHHWAFVMRKMMTLLAK